MSGDSKKKNKPYTGGPTKLKHAVDNDSRQASGRRDSSSNPEEEMNGDLLGRYFQTIAPLPVLNRGQEVLLAKQIETGRATIARLVIRYPGIARKALARSDETRKKTGDGDGCKQHENHRRLQVCIVDDSNQSDRRKKSGQSHPQAHSRMNPTHLVDRHVDHIARELRTYVERIDETKNYQQRWKNALQLVTATTGNRVSGPCISYSDADQRLVSILISSYDLYGMLRRIQQASEKIRQLEREVGASGSWLRDDLERLFGAQTQIEDAKKLLVEANLKLVVRIARRYVRRGMPLLDLIQEGNLGLMRAVETFDYRRGLRFNTYSAWWIRQRIIRATNEQGQTVRVPMPKFEAIKKMRRIVWALRAENEREPTLAEISKRMDLPEATVMELNAIDHRRHTLSLETPTTDGGIRLMDCISKTDVIDAQEAAISSDLAAALHPVFSNLTSREKEVVRRRFGIGARQTCTLQELATDFGLSRERVRQIQVETIAKLKKSLWKRRLDFTGK